MFNFKKLKQPADTNLMYLEARDGNCDLTFMGKTITITAIQEIKIIVEGKEPVKLTAVICDGTVSWPMPKKDTKRIWKALFK